MVEINFLGGCREVGRSAVQAKAGSDSFLFDYGIEVQHNTVPLEPDMPLSAAFISHAHIDHSGLCPQLYARGFTGSVYATEASISLMEILLMDSIKVQKKRGEQPHFLPGHVKRTLELSKSPTFKQPTRFKDSAVTLLDAGHIPGSASILLESKGKKILYTGDIKFMDTKLMNGAKNQVKGLDALICESTYSYKDHPDRGKLEDRLRELAQETIYNNGHLIVPSFAVGRTQELLILLHDLGFPLFMDGMGIEASEAMIHNPSSVRDSRILNRAFGKARKIRSSKDRKSVLDKPSIVLCTAGMLNGGPVSYYIKKLHDRENCAMALTGFQVEGTVGRTLMDSGRYVNEGIDVKPKMRIESLDFSAHADRTHIMEYIKQNKPKKVFLVHGADTQGFARELNKMGINAEAPKAGDKARI
jgi:putative mRNA 3-end processing factor